MIENAQNIRLSVRNMFLNPHQLRYDPQGKYADQCVMGRFVDMWDHSLTALDNNNCVCNTYIGYLNNRANGLAT